MNTIHCDSQLASPSVLTPDVSLLRGMLEIPSVSGAEGSVAAFLVEQMRLRGMQAHVDDAGNAVGVVGRPDSMGQATDIVLLGHMDTVPGAIPVRIAGDTLHGRGAVDAKGPLAAFVAAASRVDLPAGVRVVVIGAVEEESATSRGARHALSEFQPAACIIGEPSNWDGVSLGYKGRLLVEYAAERSVSHTARPGPSLADECCRWWDMVRIQAQSLRDAPRVFDCVQATLRRINTSSDGFVDRVQASGAFRLPTGIQPPEIEVLCRALAPDSATLTFSGAESAYLAPRDNMVARALSVSIREVGGIPHPKVKTGTCDMNVVAPVWQCPIAAYGPGDSQLDHTPEERISLAEYARGIEVLVGAVRRIAGELLQARSQG